jgi:hypothetical protein
MELPTLTAAHQLWWLLALLPVLFWLAQPPRPRRVLWTAHASQWRLAQEALRRQPPRFRALRWLLLSMAAVCAVLAAADPVWPAGIGPSRLFVLLDASASTAARGADGEASPFEREVAAVRELCDALPLHVAVDVAIARDGAIARRSGAAARALSDVGTPSGLLPAPLRELAAAGARPDTQVWTLSDSQMPMASAPMAGAWTQFGAVRDNAALESVTIEDRWPLGDLLVRARAIAFAPQPMQGQLTIEGAIQSSVQQPITLPPGQFVELEIPLVRAAAGGRLTITLELAGDALATDNGYRFQLPPLPQTRIAVQADEDDQGLAKKSGAALAVVTGGQWIEARPGESVGFLIVEGGKGGLPAEPGPMLSFGRAREDSTPWPAPVGIDWNRRDPLFGGLDFSELEVLHALRDALPQGETLMSAQFPDGTRAPLAVLRRGPSGSALHFAFRLQDSNLALLPAFPQLLLRTYERSQPGSHGIALEQAASPLAESDLRRFDDTPARTVPAFPVASRNLAPWCLFAALVLMALRCGVR